MKKTMPAIFFGHGNPMNALADNDFTRAWAACRSAVPEPAAVLSISAHWDGHTVDAIGWGARFENRVRACLAAGDHQPLVDYPSMGQDAVLSVPTPDHYLPLLYIIALQNKDEPVNYPVEGFDGGSVSMLAVRIG